MARQRILKPEFFKDRVIASLGAHPALVYAALWCVADDGGVARCTPELLHGEMFVRWSQFSPNVVMDCLNRLQEAGVIHIYEAGDETYCEIPNFGKHQNIQHPSKFRYPRLPQGLTEKSPVVLSEDSMSPQTDYGYGDGYGIGIERGSGGENGKPKKVKKSPVGYTTEFEEFWVAYPSRAPGSNPKRLAADRFATLVSSGEATPETLIAQAKAYALFCDTTMRKKKWIMQAATFLGEKEGWSTPYVPTWKWLEEVDDEVKRDLVGENLGRILNV